MNKKKKKIEIISKVVLTPSGSKIDPSSLPRCIDRKDRTAICRNTECNHKYCGFRD